MEGKQPKDAIKALDERIRTSQAKRLQSRGEIEAAKQKDMARTTKEAEERRRAVGEFVKGIKAFQALGYTFGEMERFLELQFVNESHVYGRAVLTWEDDEKDLRRGQPVSRVSIEVRASERPETGRDQGRPPMWRGPEGVLVKGAIEYFSGVDRGIGSDPGPDEDIFRPTSAAFEKFIPQSELGAGMEAKVEEVMLGLLDVVADAINAPEFIKTLD
jgi:hypothetical protein